MKARIRSRRSRCRCIKMDAIAQTKKIIKDRIIRNFFRTVSYPRRNAVDDLITSDPYDFSDAWRARFLDAMRWSFNHHYTNSDFYRKLCMEKDFNALAVNSFEDIWDIPFILSDVFKMYNITTKTRDMLATEVSSSGTSGRKSKIRLDRLSGQRLLFSLYHVNRALGLVSSKETNYFMMSYNPELDETLGTTASDVMMSYLTPRKEVFYGLDKGADGQVEFLKDRSVEKLRYFVEAGMPIRMLGFIHHICEVIKSYRQKYGRVIFSEGSYLVSGGGWKNIINPYGKSFDLHEFLKENTTLQLQNVRDLYTLVEHGIFYLECEEHNKHIPNVALVCSRDPRTLKRLGYGRTGLIHLYSPVLESCPSLSLLTTDYGYVEESCTCRIGGPYIKITGRAGVTKKVTCALTAGQHIKEPAKV